MAQHQALVVMMAAVPAVWVAGVILGNVTEVRMTVVMAKKPMVAKPMAANGKTRRLPSQPPGAIRPVVTFFRFR